MSDGSDLDVRRKDGTPFPVEVSLSPISGPDDALVAAIVRDRAGVAVCPEDGRTLVELIKLSDAAMYAAKRRRYPQPPRAPVRRGCVAPTILAALASRPASA